MQPRYPPTTALGKTKAQLCGFEDPLVIGLAHAWAGVLGCVAGERSRGALFYKLFSLRSFWALMWAGASSWVGVFGVASFPLGL